jgi:hypothetical protein
LIEVGLHFLPGLASNHSPAALSLQVPGMTGLSYYTRPSFFHFYKRSFENSGLNIAWQQLSEAELMISS